MKNVSRYELVVVQSPDEWESYHRIRREELFEAKGRIGIYDSNRPEERLSGNFPLLLKWKGDAIGTTRLDMGPDGTSVIRLVAVSKAEQGKGHGKVLAECVEKFAQQRGVTKFFVNAAPEALGYYKKLGYTEDIWNPAELTGISADSIQMSKVLA